MLVCSESLVPRTNLGLAPRYKTMSPSENSNLFLSQGAAYDQARAACESLQEQIKRLQRQLAELSRKRAREVGVNTSTSHTEQSSGASGAEVGLEGGRKLLSLRESDSSSLVSFSPPPSLGQAQPP